MPSDIDVVLRRGINQCSLSFQVLEQFRTPLIGNDLSDLIWMISDNCNGGATITYLFYQLSNDFIDCKDSIRILVASFSDMLKP